MFNQFHALRRFVSLPLGLTAGLLCLGALAAKPAQADITINSITGVPNPVPAAGAFAPVLIDCGGVDEVPTGNAVLTNAATGQIVSQNAVAYYQDDSSGNPIVYAYVVFPVNHNPTNSITYTLTVTVADQSGHTSSRTMTLVQGLKAPITINSITPNPSVLQATTPSVIVSADLTANGTNQAGYQSGVAFLLDSAGNTLDVQAFQGAPVPDGSGSYIYKTYALSHIPANTSASARTFTISVQVKDNTGVWSYASVPLTQLAGSTAPAATSLAAASASGTAGQSVTLSATLSTGSAAVSGRTLSFLVDGSSVGTGTTNGSGVASFSYTIPGGATVGSHTVTASFAGDSSYASASSNASLQVNAAPLTGTTVTIPTRTCTVPGQTRVIRATLTQTVGGAALSGKTVTFTLNGSLIGTAVTNAYGLAQLSYDVPASAPIGNEILAVSFAGDSAYSAASGQGQLGIKYATQITVPAVSGSGGASVALSATLTRKSDNAGVKGKTITFLIDGAAVGTAVTNASGTATLTYAGASAGSHRTTASFGADGTYDQCSGSGTLTLN